MEIKRGSCRIALVGKRFTVKVPQVKVRRAVGCLCDAITMGKGTGDWGFLREFITGPESELFTLAESLFKGWNENRREARRSGQFPELVVPTRLSLLGMLNVMDTAGEANMYELDISPALKQAGLDATIPREHPFNHTVRGRNNYGQYGGSIRFVDYGESGIDELLEQKRAQLREFLARLNAAK